MHGHGPCTQDVGEAGGEAAPGLAARRSPTLLPRWRRSSNCRWHPLAATARRRCNRKWGRPTDGKNDGEDAAGTPGLAARTVHSGRGRRCALGGGYTLRPECAARGRTHKDTAPTKAGYEALLSGGRGRPRHLNIGQLLLLMYITDDFTTEKNNGRPLRRGTPPRV